MRHATPMVGNMIWNDIRAWGAKNGLRDPDAQFEKLLEEVTELYGAMRTRKLDGIVDGVADCTITLTNLLASYLDAPPIEAAVETVGRRVIQRTGHTVEGILVKDDYECLYCESPIHWDAPGACRNCGGLLVKVTP